MQWNAISKRIPDYSAYARDNFFLKDLSGVRVRMMQTCLYPLKNHNSVHSPNVIEAKQYWQSLISVYAARIGAEESQVIHAMFLTTQGDALIYLKEAVEKNLSKHTLTTYEAQTTKDGIVIKIPRYRYEGLSLICLWNAKSPDQVKIEDISPAIAQEWVRCQSIMTRHEMEAEGSKVKRDDREQKVKDATKKVFSTVTSKKNAMKGVQVINAKQVAKQSVEA